MASLLTSSTKSRAKSCTSCRQSKLRCDVRVRYPAPCSRCSMRRQECKMDPSFKRVNRRSRFGQSSEAQNTGRWEHPQAPPNVVLSSPSNIQHSISSGANSSTQFQQSAPLPAVVGSQERPLSQETWLCLNSPSDNPGPPHIWLLGSLEIDRDVIIDLYKQFEEFYYVHIPILEPVTSLQKLYMDSRALFWAIAFTASRHHPRHSHLYLQMKQPFQSLISGVLSSAVQALKDLQALLIICQWPIEVGTGSEDPSWMHSGFVVNAALNMGLDKSEDEVLFGYRRAKNSLGLYDRKYRRRTWMKVFQISTQLCTWHGLQPHISSAKALLRVSELCEEEPVSEAIPMTEIQRQVARNTASLDELSIVGPHISLVHTFIQEMDAIRRKHAGVWSTAAEINFLGAKLFCFAHSLLLTDQQESGSRMQADADHFVATILQQGHRTALELIKVVKDLGFAGRPDPPCAKPEDGGVPLLAHPKHHFRLAFFACVFLLKYLDCNKPISSADRSAASNAVSTLHQVFSQFSSREEICRAVRTLEVLGRSVVPGEQRMKTMVKTRMGASLCYNAIWTASKLRGREHDPEYSVAASGPEQETAVASSSNVLGLRDSATAEGEPSDASIALPPALDPFFPWGLWDDAAYDQLGFGPDDQSLSVFPGAMDIF